MARIIQTENGRLKKQYFIDADTVSIGRSSDNHIHIDDKSVSSQHAQIFIERDSRGNEMFFLMDLNSKNGSYINTHKIDCKHLKHKDRIKFGPQQFIFIDDKVYRSTITRPHP